MRFDIFDITAGICATVLCVALIPWFLILLVGSMAVICCFWHEPWVWGPITFIALLLLNKFVGKKRPSPSVDN